jgi:hypothetical protein
MKGAAIALLEREAAMSEPHDPPASDRSTFLGMFLAVLSTGFFFLVLILITGGFFFYVALAGALLVGLGSFHYLLWGRLLRQELADEIAHEELARRARAEEVAPPEGTGFRR